MSHIKRNDADRRDTDRRGVLGAISVGTADNDNRIEERREYLDRRMDPEWRQRWLRTRVSAALRD